MAMRLGMPLRTTLGGPATMQRCPVLDVRRMAPISRQQRLAVVAAAVAAPAAAAGKVAPRPEETFKLPVAVAMAAASFQAYLDPAGAQPHLEDRTARGTHTTYMCKDFLLEQFEGVLQVTIKDATNLLLGKDAKGDRTIISLGKGGGILRDVGPNWGQNFALYTRDLKSTSLKLTAIDVVDGKDVHLGSVEQPLAKFADGKPHSLELTLPGKDGKPASVTLEASFVPFDGETAVAFVADDPQVEPVPDKRAPVVNDHDVAEKVARTKAAASGRASVLAPPTFKKLAGSMGPAEEILEMLQPIAFIENVITDTQVYVCRSKKLRTVVVAFRGTEKVKKEDVASDASLLQTNLYTQGTPGVTPAMLKIKVHKGFLAAHRSVQEEVSSLVDELTSDGSQGPWQVYVAGHSLGGALATLCTHALVSRPDHESKNQVVSKYTYGEPRVGNEEFADDFNSKAAACFRMVNPKDVVPRIPYLMGYCHVNTGVALQEAGGYKFVTAREDMPGDGTSNLELAALAANHVLGKVMPWMKKNGELQSILKQQAEIADSLKDGSGVTQHMEDYYFKTIKKTVELHQA